MIGRARRALLNRAHHYLYDRSFVKYEIHRTDQIVPAHDLAFDDRFRRHSAEYAPTPRWCVHWAISSLGVNLAEYSFVDVGSGRGRVLMTAAVYPFRSIVGYEFDEALALQAKQNIEGLRRRTNDTRLIESRHVNAVTATHPRGPTVFFMYNPFGREVMDLFLESISERKEREADIILGVNIKTHDVLEAYGYTKSILPWRISVSATLLSPYAISKYSLMEAPPKAGPRKRNIK